MTAVASIEEAELRVRSFYRFLSGDTTVSAEDIVSDDWQDIPIAPGLPAGADGLRATGSFLAAAFDPLEIDVVDVVVTADKVAARTVARGIHHGEFFGVPATGRSFAFSSCDIHHLSGGLLHRSWHLEDIHSLLQQLQAEIETVAPQIGAHS